MTPAWRAGEGARRAPRLAIAIASSAIEMRSPAVSSMSSSRRRGSGVTCCGEVEQLVGRVAHRATPRRRRRCRPCAASTMRSATRLMRSASATDEPPYFCTTRPIGTSCGSGGPLSLRAAGRYGVGGPTPHVCAALPGRIAAGPPRTRPTAARRDAAAASPSLSATGRPSSACATRRAPSDGRAARTRPREPPATSSSARVAVASRSDLAAPRSWRRRRRRRVAAARPVAVAHARPAGSAAGRPTRRRRSRAAGRSRPGRSGAAPSGRSWR